MFIALLVEKLTETPRQFQVVVSRALQGGQPQSVFLDFIHLLLIVLCAAAAISPRGTQELCFWSYSPPSLRDKILLLTAFCTLHS